MLVLTVIFVFYFLLLIAFLIGWKDSGHAVFPPAVGREPLISVIIPVRNEESSIGNLLSTLATQEYPNFEVIIVNDDSEDETLQAVSQHQLKNLIIIHNPGKGKKWAISAGVRAARGSIIVTTDADCTVSTQWLHEMRRPFRHNDVMLAFGGVRMAGAYSFFDALQSIEFSSLIGVGASSAALGMPTMCNGANLAFRKKVFQQVKGYEGNLGVPSGDDEFLLRKIHQKYPAGIQFVHSPEAVVSTAPQPDMKAFFNQRIRWASKWRDNTSVTARALAALVLVFQTAFIVNWFFIFSPSILHALFLITVKIILEAAFLLQVCRFLRIRWNWLAFFSLQALYPLYALGVGVASFFQPFEWKHRVFKPKKFFP